MTVHKTYFDRWWKRNTKHIGLYNYKVPWKEIGQKPIWRIRTNGASRKNGDTCFDLTIFLGYIVFNYTNWDWQKVRKYERVDSDNRK